MSNRLCPEYEKNYGISGFPENIINEVKSSHLLIMPLLRPRPLGTKRLKKPS